jgi:hypothetical protein
MAAQTNIIGNVNLGPGALVGTGGPAAVYTIPPGPTPAPSTTVSISP